jgi:general stress protein 26
MIPAESIDVAAVRELMKSVKYAMVTTRCAQKALRSHPLATLETSFDGIAWFLVAADSKLADDVHLDPEVSLTYADPRGGTYVAVSGSATVAHDPAAARALWNRWADAFFPDGPEDPRVAVLRVQMRAAEFWTLDQPARDHPDSSDVGRHGKVEFV